MQRRPVKAARAGLMGALVCLLMALVALDNGWWHSTVVLGAGAALLLGWSGWIARSDKKGQ